MIAPRTAPDSFSPRLSAPRRGLAEQASRKIDRTEKGGARKSLSRNDPEHNEARGEMQI